LNSSVWVPKALLAEGWRSQVALSIDEGGDITGVLTDVDAGDAACEHVYPSGVLLPGIPNVHSHAHQRALAGLAEQRGGAGGDDSFWGWRAVMYRFLARMSPEDLHAIARQLYLEMLKAGYTSVGEFQYLHHDQRGRAYANRAEMSLQCLAAAADVGITCCVLPVLYCAGGFGGRPAEASQGRFINSVEQFGRLVEALQAAASRQPGALVGIAPHSLRAVDEVALGEALSLVAGTDAPIHVHIAEQMQEVEDCVHWSGERPVRWLLDRFEVGPRWCLVHATWMDQGETKALATSGAVAGLCPTTEANLGDGFFNAPSYLHSGGRWAIGSDSHVSVDPVEELRWLEYGQRLRHRERNVMARGAGAADVASTGRALLEMAVSGGNQACGRPRAGGLGAGQRADFVILDGEHPRLASRSGDALIDSWVFSGNERLVRHVYVGGRRVITDGRHAAETEIAAGYRRALARLTA
jgi:formimidoylglutamate deiminase